MDGRNSRAYAYAGQCKSVKFPGISFINKIFKRLSNERDSEIVVLFALKDTYLLPRVL